VKTYTFPYIAFGLGVTLMLLVIIGGQVREQGSTAIPLLTLLVVSEFAFFVTAIGGYLGIKRTLETGIKPLYATVTVLCGLLSVWFLWMGIQLWPK
jgi:hypothetical protein